MADSENIGGIDVSITGDYSSLQASFASAQTDAAAAGTKIADAFNGSAATGTDTLASSMGNLAQQMAAVGSALVITDGLKDFGQAALDASDTITRAQISLTTLTGSATQASGEISQLESLAEQDGLSMPNLLTAATRMQSLLGAGADVPGLLTSLANAAAVSGQDIGSAANALDRIATSGTVAARQLTPLGLNLTDVANAFNTLTNSSEATELNISAVLKTLSEPERVLVMQTALQKLGDVAQQVADQTFGGQWNQLVAQWNQVLVSAGNALEPVIADLVQLAKTDIVPTLQGIADAFSALPAPVKDTLVDVALLVAAMAPLAAAIGTVAIAVKGWSALTDATLALKALAAQSVETGAAEVTLAGETASVGVAAGGAIGGVGLMTGGLIALGIASLDVFAKEAQLVGAWKGAADQQNELNATQQRLIQSLQNMGIETSGLVNDFNAAIKSGEDYGQASDELNTKARALIATYQETHAAQIQQKAAIDQTADAVKALITTVGTQDIAYQSAVLALGAVNTALATGNPLYKQQSANLEDQWAALEKVNASASKIPEALGSVSLALANDTMEGQKATLSYNALSGAYQALLASGTATTGQLEAAFQKMEAAEASAATAGAPVAGSLQAIDVQANAAINSSKLLATNFGVLSDMATAQTDALSDNDAQVSILSQKLDLLVTAQQNVAAKVAAGTAQYSQQVDIQKQVVTTAGQLQDALDKQAIAQANAGNQAAIAGGNVGVLIQELDNANIALDQATQKADAGTISIGAWASAQKAAATAAINLGEAAGEAASGMKGSTDALSLLGTEAGGATGKLQALTQAYKDGLIGPKEYSSGVTDALNAQIAFDGQRAISDAGLANSTTQWGLLQAAVLLAKAKVDDLTTAQQNGIPVQEQLTQATADLKTKQDAYNAAVSASHTPLGNASTDVKNLTSDATNAIPVMGELGVAMGDVGVKALGMATSVQSAVNSVEAAINSIAGTSAGFSGSGRVTETGFGSFGQPIYSVTATLPPETVFKDAMEAALAAADQQSNPKGGTDPLSVATEALAEATATLKVDETYFGQTSSTGSQLVTVSALQSAQSAVATAQSALANLQGGSSSGAAVLAPGGGVVGTVVNGVVVPTGSGTSTTAAAPAETLAQAQSGVTAAQAAIAAAMATSSTTAAQMAELQVILAQAQDTLATIAAGGTVATTTSTSASTSTGGSEDTSSYGGSYPGVVAHQAAGEVWVVDTSGVASGSSGGTATAAGSSDATSALAATSTADAVASAADTIATVVSQLGLLSQSSSQLGAGQYGALDNAAVATGGTTAVGSVTSATGYFAINGVVLYLVNGQLANGTYNGLVFVNGVATGVAAGVAGGSTPTGNYQGTLPSTGGTFTSGGNPAGPTVPVTPPAAQVPGVTAAAAGSGSNTISVAVDMRGAMVGNQAQMLQMVTAAVQKGLTQNLFQAGARLTQA